MIIILIIAVFAIFSIMKSSTTIVKSAGDVAKLKADELERKNRERH